MHVGAFRLHPNVTGMWMFDVCITSKLWVSSNLYVVVSILSRCQIRTIPAVDHYICWALLYPEMISLLLISSHGPSSVSLRESAWRTKVPPSAWAGTFRIRSTASTTPSWSWCWWSGSSVSAAPACQSQRPERWASRPGWKTDVWVQRPCLINYYFYFFQTL